jgi:hypothetical protein
MKDLITTPMYFHETNGQIVQTTYKSMFQCLTNLIKPSYTINRSMRTDQRILPVV